MPYEHLMPKTLQGRNERLGEPIGESHEQAIRMRFRHRVNTKPLGMLN
jgi:hypothetical protein